LFRRVVLIVGVVYDRMHSREISTYGGLVHRMPFYAGVFMACSCWPRSGCPAPAASRRVLVIDGLFQVNTWVAAFICTGIIPGAAYMLWLYRRVIFGELDQGQPQETSSTSTAARSRCSQPSSPPCSGWASSLVLLRGGRTLGRRANQQYDTVRPPPSQDGT